MQHTETFKKVGRVDLVEGEEGFKWIEIEVVTTGNVRKLVRIPHFHACGLRMAIECNINTMTDAERKTSWRKSIAWIRERAGL